MTRHSHAYLLSKQQSEPTRHLFAACVLHNDMDAQTEHCLVESAVVGGLTLAAYLIARSEVRVRGAGYTRWATRKVLYFDANTDLSDGVATILA
jgi:hypothetical protein